MADGALTVTPVRRLIVNADDFGLSPGVNRGIIEAHARGIVTSASLMVRCPAAAEAAAFAREHPRLSVGLHVDLGEWVCRDGGWVARYVVVPTDQPAAVEAEVRQQLDAFRALMGRAPTHLDSHQHVHRVEPARAVFVTVARELGVPLRHCTRGLRYCGDFYGQTSTGDPLPHAIEAETLIALLRGLRGEVTELACHPGHDLDLGTTYRAERSSEVAALCDPRVRAALTEERIQLCSFSDLRLPDILHHTLDEL